MDPAPGFRLRHPLDPVNAGFVFQPGIGPGPGNDKIRLFHAAKFRFVVVHQLDFPAPGGGVHGVHPEQAVGEQSAFLAAHAPTNFHNDVFAVVGVLGQQKHLQFPI